MDEKRVVHAFEAADRLDKFLAGQTELSRSHIKNAILAGDIRVNGGAAKPGDKLKAGDEITLRLHAPKTVDVTAEDIPVDIVYQDSDIVVVNKPQGMVVHPAPGNEQGTLVNALLHHIGDLSGINGELRPGIVHRIDKDTSGLLVVAKNDSAHASLSAQIAEKSARRIYTAILHGNVKQDAVTVDKAIARSRRDRKKMAVDPAGRSAVTHFKVFERFGEFTLVRAQLETGRTHQIRVHAAYIHHPVAGDVVYGPKKPRLHKQGQLLHAAKLVLIHPSTGCEMAFEAPLPDYFEKALAALRSKRT